MPNLKIIHPALGEYSFYRSDVLAIIESRYIRLGHDQFKDRITNENLIEDKVDGQFKLAGESVGPGYYTFSGLKNYKELFFDPATKFVFFKSLTWTFAWAALSVLLTFSLGAFLAVVLNDLQGRSKFIYRMIFIIPYSIPFFISVLIFKGMLNKDFGEINTWLNAFTISPVPWLENKWWAKVSVLMVNLWLGFPYMLLVITGIIQSIPKSIYEASSLEGATKFQNFRFLTFPLVLRSMVPLLIGSFAFNMNNFVGIYLLTGGGPVIPNVSAPVGETDILISYTYRLAFEGAQGQNFGMAAAVSVLIFFIVVVLTVMNFRVSKLINK
jgi:maltose/maltodextrin transport system permease protein